MRRAARVAGLFLAVLFYGGVFSPMARAADPPLFEKDRTYVFVWFCAPTWMADAAALAGLTGGVQVANCFHEDLKILIVREDGWLVVQDTSDNSIWKVNPARAMAVKQHVDLRPARTPRDRRAEPPATGGSITRAPWKGHARPGS